MSNYFHDFRNQMETYFNNFFFFFVFINMYYTAYLTLFNIKILKINSIPVCFSKIKHSEHI